MQSPWSSAAKDLIGQNYSLQMAALLTAFTLAHLFLVFFNLLQRLVPLNFLQEALKHPIPTTWSYPLCFRLPLSNFYSLELFAILHYNCATTAEQPPVKPGMCCLYSIKDFRRPNPTALPACTHYSVKGGTLSNTAELK